MKNRELQAFLDTVCAQVKHQEVHDEIRLELGSHLEDCVEMHMGAGLSEAAAVAHALRDMGDPVAIGQQLHETHKPRTEWGLMGATLLLILLGGWAMYAVDASQSFAPGISFFGKKLVWSALGLAAGGALFFFDYRRLRRYSLPLYTVTLAGILLLSLRATWVSGQAAFVGHTPLVFAVALAGLFTTWDWNRPWALMKAVALFAGPMLGYLLAGQVGVSLQYAVVFAVLLLLSRPRRWQMGVLTGLGTVTAGAVALHVWTTPYLRERLHALFSPLTDPLGRGYQAVQARLAIGQAGWWGQGALANLERLPEVHTDFVFSYLVYTLGWVAGAAIFVVIAFFIGRMLLAARQVKDLYGSHLIVAVVTLFAYRFGWHLGMTVGLLPVAGVDLPFVSYGMQSAMQVALVGLVLGVFRRKDLNRSSLLPE